MSKTWKRRTGLTLIELLVAMSSVAVLVAMMLPAMAGERQSAITAQCASNLHQVDLGIHLYARDHDGRPPMAYYWSSKGMPNKPEYRGYGAILFHEKYVSSIAAFFCPDQTFFQYPHAEPDPASAGWSLAGANWSYVGYGASSSNGFMPAKISPNTGFDPGSDLVRISAIGSRASSLIILAEAHMPHLEKINSHLDGRYNIVPIAGSGTDLACRHGGGATANVAFLDGQVKLSKASDLGFDVKTQDWNANFNFRAAPWWLYHTW